MAKNKKITKGKVTKNDSDRKGIKRDWAMLVYIAGDNNLSDFGLSDIQEMCDEGASDKLYVGVEIDTRGEHTGSIRYEITEEDDQRKWNELKALNILSKSTLKARKSPGYRKVVARLPEKDTGDPNVLGDFLNWGIKYFPADSRLVVVWGHGYGFRYLQRGAGRGIAPDDFGTSLDMPEITNVCKRVFRENNINKIQIVGFDACLMNMLEVVHHLSDLTEIVVGSQQTEPGKGWPYHKVINRAKSTNKPEDFATGIVTEYIKYYKNLGVENVTQSAIWGDKTKLVVKEVGNLGKEMKKNINDPDFRLKLNEIRTKVQSFQMADYVDLIHLSELIVKENLYDTLSSTANDVTHAADDCIIKDGNNPKYKMSLGKAVENANGLSIWFPPTNIGYFYSRAKYLELKCNKTSFGWTEFLDAYHGCYT